jgi:hypothetical protein
MVSSMQEKVFFGSVPLKKRFVQMVALNQYASARIF